MADAAVPCVAAAARCLRVVMRHVSPSIEKCELTCIAREPISLAECQKQHAEYEALFRSLKEKDCFNVELVVLGALQDFPDSVFVEDTAILFPECAIISNPGAASRRREVEAIVETVSQIFEAEHLVHRVCDPALVDGGDVLVAGKFVFIGQSTRTNAAAVEQMQRFLEPHGYLCVPCEVRGCLHLKSAASLLASGTVLINPQWIDGSIFASRGLKVLSIPDPDLEVNAANVLSFRVERNLESGRVDALRIVAVPEHYPRLHKFLVQHFSSHPTDDDGAVVSLRTLPSSELAKAEGALTCCSLLVLRD